MEVVVNIRYFDFEIDFGELTVATNMAIGTCGRMVWESHSPAPAPVVIEHEGVLVVRDDLFLCDACSAACGYNYSILA
jgi:hypothetical protein